MAVKLSPRYPNISLEEAIRHAGVIHKADRCNPVDREVAAKHLGFAGLNGSSERVLSALVHFGLLDRLGKGEVRVSPTAVDILHPDTPQDGKRALRQAAMTPSLFRDLQSRYGDTVPSDESLRAYLPRLGFLDSAVSPAAKAYLETRHYLEQMGANDSGSHAQPELIGSGHELVLREEKAMEAIHVEAPKAAPPPAVVEAALNDIRTDISGGLVRISATLDRSGLIKLKRKIDAMLMLVEDDEDQVSAD